MKPELKIIGVLGFLGSLLTTALPARAQFDSVVDYYSGLSSSLMMNAQFNNVQDAIVNSGEHRHSQPTHSQPTYSSNATNPTHSVSLAYALTPALKQQTEQGWVNRLRGNNPHAAQVLSQAFASGQFDYDQLYVKVIDNTGLRDNDAADAMSAYMLVGYLIVNNIQDDNAITPQMGRAVRSQIAPRFASNPQFTAPGVPAQLGEELKLQTVLTAIGWKAAIQQNTLPSYQQSVAATFKRYGMDMSQVTLTNNGFVRKSS